MGISKLKCGTCGSELEPLTYFDGVPEKMACLVCKTIHIYTVTKDKDGNMVEKATQGAAEGSVATRPELLEKLRRLNEREADVAAQKKGEMKAFNDQLKDLKDEKKTVLESLKKMPAPAEKK